MNAELHSAYAWDCDECGTENFVRAIAADLDEEVMRQAMERGQDVDQHFQAIGEDGATEFPEIVTAIAIAPVRVTCRNCGMIFETALATREE
jgi:predicted  nucleic acid-binding Zn-ribbon protein